MVPGIQGLLRVETCVQVDQLSGWCPGRSLPQLESQVGETGKVIASPLTCSMNSREPRVGLQREQFRGKMG